MMVMVMMIGSVFFFDITPDCVSYDISIRYGHITEIRVMIKKNEKKSDDDLRGNINEKYILMDDR